MVYVLQEGIPCDDISVVEALDQVDAGDPDWAGRSVPCVVATAARGTVRLWCEEHGIRLVPKEFFPGQIDYVVWFGTDEKRRAFEQKWLHD
jgi:hypothetical protein